MGYITMTKEEVNKLHEELNELSASEEQNLKRMVEIAKILNAHYMWKKNDKKNSSIDTPKKLDH